MNELTKLQLDALKEIGTIGAGHAATSLSEMIGKRVEVTVPKAIVLNLEDVPDALGGPGVIVSAVFFLVDGEIDATFILLFSLDEGKKMVDLLTFKELGQTKMIDEFGKSALKELGNVTAGAYLTALSKVTGIKTSYSVPNYASDMLGAVIDGVLIHLSLEAKDAMVIEAEFMIGKDVVRGNILFLPEPKGLEIILGKVGLK